MAIKPAIVISAYNRPASLSRLLSTVEKAIYATRETDLIISIDKSDSDAVRSVAGAFVWQYGRKRIISHATHLGLKAHILSCGNLTAEYGAIILLEDDLLVSPYFYSYAQQAFEQYRHDPKIAGISLYNYQVAESCFYPFNAIDDGADVYFMQVASSWGQLWTKAQWKGFTGWLNHHPVLPAGPGIPAYLQAWGQHSWKKHFIHYLVDTERYFVFPRLSLSTNCEAAGTNAATKNTFHVPLQLSGKTYTFKDLEHSGAVYDAWFELLPACLSQLNKNLQAYDYAVDLYGEKNTAGLQCGYILTSKAAEGALFSFGAELFPLESNIAMQQPGSALGLYALQHNNFQPRELPLRNALAEQGKADGQGISVVIPVSSATDEQLAATLVSVATQAFKNKQCILVSNTSISFRAKEIIERHNLSVKIVHTDHADMDAMISAGFKNAGKGILTWILPGNTFTEGALGKAASVFATHLTVSWIRGVDESFNNAEAYNNLDVRKYRLAPATAYRRLSAGSLHADLEQDLFRKHCLAEGAGERPFTGGRMFMAMIAAYQLNIVVAKLGAKNMNDRSALSAADTKHLLEKYRYLQQKEQLSVLVIDSILQKLFPRMGISRWFYTAVNNFPDVLRYDAVHNSFYSSKY